MKAVAIVLLALLLGACSKVHETTLSNGLKVIVKEDHRSPVVVSQIWYKVGSVDEPGGITGISHVLEHMMFKGTTRYKAGEFSRIIAEHGGRENAFTGRDYTAYFQQLEKSRLPISFELEADRMQNLLLNAAELRKEVQVVLEERRLRTDDKPDARVYEQFMQTAYRAHPYQHPIIGSVRDLESLTLEDVRNWYERWYVPNNATLVVVGDVQPREVVALAKQYFGHVPRREVPPREVQFEPLQQEPRRAEVSMPAEVPYILLGFHVPALGREAAWEPYALDVLAGVLDGGDSARFSSRLVRGEQIAASADADYSAVARYPTVFLFDAVPAGGKSLADVERAILDEVERLKDELISAGELARVKAQVTASDIYSRDSVFNQAMMIGMLETANLDWRLIDTYVKRVRAITPEQVQAVAKKYLDRRNLTVVTLNPLPAGKGAKRPRPAPEVDHVR